MNYNDHHSQFAGSASTELRSNLQIQIPGDTNNLLGIQGSRRREQLSTAGHVVASERQHYINEDIPANYSMNNPPTYMRSVSTSYFTAAAAAGAHHSQNAYNFPDTYIPDSMSKYYGGGPGELLTATPSFPNPTTSPRYLTASKPDYELDGHPQPGSFSFHHGQPHPPIFPSMNINVSMKMNLGLPTAPRQYDISSYDYYYEPSSHHHAGPPMPTNYPMSASRSFGPAPSHHPPALNMTEKREMVSHHVTNFFGDGPPTATGAAAPPSSRFPYSHQSPRDHHSHSLVTYRATSELQLLRRDSLLEKPNLCRICGKTYARPSTLKTHMRTHSGERPYKCSVCQKTFSQTANLTAHMRTHSGEKPFCCQICDRRFSQSSSVTTHMRTHSGERPYRCRMCKKAFSDSSTLTKHLRVHSGEKPYQCKICLLRFSQSGNLNRHMRVHTSTPCHGIRLN